MLILLSPRITPPQRQAVEGAIRSAGCGVREVERDGGTLLLVEGDLGGLRSVPLGVYPGVQRIVKLSSSYALAGLEHQAEPTVVEVGSARIGDGGLTVIAGPCAVEDAETLKETARRCQAAGADMLRGGAYKPRTSPYAFRGLGPEGLRMLREVSLETGLPTVSEVMDPRHIETCMNSVDLLQIGTRNMSNFELLVEVGRCGHPVLLKRGRSATVGDWLNAAEYVLTQGNANVVLCERGVRGFDSATRNLLDLSAVPVVKSRSHLPVIVDPSHATGHAAYVPAMARAACAAGADGVMVEVHVDPQRALCDADQAVKPDTFRDLCEELRVFEKVRARPTDHRDDA